MPVQQLIPEIGQRYLCHPTQVFAGPGGCSGVAEIEFLAVVVSPTGEQFYRVCGDHVGAHWCRSRDVPQLIMKLPAV